MEDRQDSQQYRPPSIEDYGTLEELTADSSLLSPLGLGGTMAAVTAPIVPGGGGGGGGGGQGTTSPVGATSPEVDFGGGDVVQTGGENASPGGGGGGGGAGGPGGAGGGGSGGGGGGGELPFTGFPAVFAGAVGGVMTATGAAIRRALRSRR
jgi:hypothetical protein